MVERTQMSSTFTTNDVTCLGRVRGMYVDDTTGRVQVYKGAEHPHVAQKPENITGLINGRF